MLQDSFFGPYLGQLARLAFLSSAIHQAVFTVFSSLPFAVGQVLTQQPLGGPERQEPSCIDQTPPLLGPAGDLTRNFASYLCSLVN